MLIHPVVDFPSATMGSTHLSTATMAIANASAVVFRFVPVELCAIECCSVQTPVQSCDSNFSSGSSSAGLMRHSTRSSLGVVVYCIIASLGYYRSQWNLWSSDLRSAVLNSKLNK
jgi:hypothetical protein